MTQGEQEGNKQREENATSRNSVYGIVDSHLSATQLCSVSSFGGRQHSPIPGDTPTFPGGSAKKSPNTDTGKFTLSREDLTYDP